MTDHATATTVRCALTRKYSDYARLHTQPVPVGSISTSRALSQFTSSPDATPLYFPLIQPPESRQASKSQGLLSALRSGEDRVINVEVGRYDDRTPGAFDHVSMRLGQYIDWLETNTSGEVGGRQVYLAQWRGSEDVSTPSRYRATPY